jgi:aspartate kinase
VGDGQGERTTMSRGGSDTTAVALAAQLHADECQIYTDVDGVYTADPRIVPHAARLQTITLEEMLELASLGSKVLQMRSVAFAGMYHVPVRVLSSMAEGPGTLICLNRTGESMEEPLVSGVAHDRQQAQITVLGVPDRPGIAFQILGVVAAANIEVDMIVQNISGTSSNTTDLTFTCPRADFETALALVRAKAQTLGAHQVSGNDQIAKVSIVGMGMRSHAGVASRMFAALAQEGINILMISTSEIKISVVVAEKYVELAVRALHEAFHLDQGACMSLEVQHDSLRPLSLQEVHGA